MENSPSNTKSSSTTTGTPDPREELRSFVQAVHVMKLYAASEGLAVPEKTRAHIAELVPIEIALAAERTGPGSGASAVPPLDVQVAIVIAMQAHADLLIVVAPATPASISYTEAPRSLRDFVRRQWLLFFLILTAVAAVSGLIMLLVWKGQLGESASRVQGVRQALLSFEKRLDEIEPLKKEPERFATDLAAIVSDLEQRNEQLKRGLGSGFQAAPDWPDEEIMLALTDMGDQNSTTEGAATRIRTAIASFREKHRFDEGASTLHSAVCDQLLNLCAALLGAAFLALYTANRYVVQRTFDRAYTTQYVVRLALGIVSGMILANFGQYLLENKASGAPAKEAITLAQTTLALLGGYAADAVNAVLTRVSETLTTLVVGREQKKPEADSPPSAKPIASPTPSKPS